MKWSLYISKLFDNLSLLTISYWMLLLGSHCLTAWILPHTQMGGGKGVLLPGLGFRGTLPNMGCWHHQSQDILDTLRAAASTNDLHQGSWIITLMSPICDIENEKCYQWNSMEQIMNFIFKRYFGQFSTQLCVVIICKPSSAHCSFAMFQASGLTLTTEPVRAWH